MSAETISSTNSALRSEISGKRVTFRDGRFMSAAEKRSVLKAWITFLKQGCRKEHFTERLYQHIAVHCSFIAHYSRLGFYDFYFTSPGERTTRLFDQFDPKKPGISAEMGDIFWLGDSATGADLNRAMREAAGPYVDRLRQEFGEMKRQADLALATAIAAKYGKLLADCDMPDPSHNPLESSAQACSLDSGPEQLSIFNTTG
jgi:hypothetical protein